LRSREVRSAVAAVLIATIGAVTVVLVLVHPSRGSRALRAPAVTAPKMSPAYPLLLRQLSTQAARLPKRAGVSRVRGSLVLTRAVDGLVWRFAYLKRGRDACWLLIAPHDTGGGTCGTTPHGGQPIFIYAGVLPDPHRPSRLIDGVFYGLVSRRVRALEFERPDCSTVSVNLSSRPLFWVPMTRRSLDRKIVPKRLVAHLVGGRTIRGLLPNLEPGSDGRTGKRCSKATFR
jgi:hypothetical protein